MGKFTSEIWEEAAASDVPSEARGEPGGSARARLLRSALATDRGGGVGLRGAAEAREVSRQHSGGIASSVAAARRERQAGSAAMVRRFSGLAGVTLLLTLALLVVTSPCAGTETRPQHELSRRRNLQSGVSRQELLEWFRSAGNASLATPRQPFILTPPAQIESIANAY